MANPKAFPEGKMQMPEPPENVVALSRWRALLARTSSARRRVELVLSDPRARELVPAIPAEDFYYLVKEVGLGDALPLLQLASAEQIQTCLDFEVWDRDRVDPDRTAPWLEALTNLPPGKLLATAEGLDFELLSYLFCRYARIYDRTEGEEPPENTPHAVYETPDSFFFVEFVTPSRQFAMLLERLLDSLYRADLSFPQRLLLDAKWGLPSELEETSYRWRTGRMADLGFFEYFEAIEVYAPLDPEKAKQSLGEPTLLPYSVPRESALLPAPFAESLAEETFLGRVLASLASEEELSEATGALVTLFNRVLAADRADPGELEEVREAVRAARDTLSLGLEYLAEGDLERAREILLRRPLVWIFRVGHSLTLELGRRARALYERGIDDPTLDPLLARHPRYPRALDDPPYAGERPFRTLEDLRRVDAYLGSIESN